LFLSFESLPSTVLFFKLKMMHQLDKYNIIKCPIEYRSPIVEKSLRLQCGKAGTTVRCSQGISQITNYLYYERILIYLDSVRCNIIALSLVN